MRSSLGRRLTRLHRQAGIVVAVFVMLLAVTGIALNRSETLQLQDRYAPAFVASFYLSAESVQGRQHEGKMFYELGGDLYADGQDLATCESFRDILTFDRQLVALCDGELVLFTPGLQLIERIDSSKGVPKGVTAIRNTRTQLQVSSGEGWQGFDPLMLTTSVAEAGANEHTAEWSPVPEDYLLAKAVTWQQFLLDLHSGAVLSVPGKLFMDIVALLLVFMAVSGIIMWREPRRNRLPRKRGWRRRQTKEP